MGTFAGKDCVSDDGRVSTFAFDPIKPPMILLLNSISLVISFR